MSKSQIFSENMIDPNPFIQFKSWYSDHLKEGIAIPEAMTLATSSNDGHVSARTVLLKDYDDKGFLFFTNYRSRKSSQLALNPKAALLFYWPESGRQIRIEGVTEKIPEADSESYHRTRPRESQLSAWASEQSSVIPDRQHLEKLYNFYKNSYSEKQIEKPPHWGGFRLIPDWFEFWQNGEYRLHDRMTYTKREDLWIIKRLAP